MTRRGRQVLIASTAVLAGLVAVGWILARGLGGPLEGESRHDFGVVRIVEPPAEVDHVFRLRNGGDAPLVIVNVTRSCNCASVETSADVVEAGGPLDVTVTMKLRSASEKKSRITLVLNDGERDLTHDLFVTARGERVSPPAAPGSPAESPPGDR